MAVLVDKFCHFETSMSKEQIAGEMDRVINDADIQKMVQVKTATAPLGQMENKQAGSGERESYVI